MSYYSRAFALYPEDKEVRRKYLIKNFQGVMFNLKNVITCSEMDIVKNSMTYVFEHIKNSMVSLIGYFVSDEDKTYLEKKQWTDIKYRKKLFDILVDLENKSVLIWMFLHFNYYITDDLDIKRKILLENIEMFNKYYPEKLYFKSVDELFIVFANSNPLYSISYHNRNNKDVLSSYSKMLRKICPDLHYNGLVNRKTSKSPNEKIKVCFFSDLLTLESSVLRDRIGIISQLPTDKFDIYYMGFKAGDKISGLMSKTFYSMLKTKYIQLPEKISDCRKFIENKKFDVLVYCEIGMQVRAQFLSYARLAPIQVNTWGHSETSGIDTIDYFVSSKYFEIEQPQGQYSEKIYLMDSLSTYYYPPSKILLSDNYVFKSRKDLNLSDDDHIYGCIQSSFKISEEFEKIIDGILKNDPKGKIILSYYQPFCKSQIERMRRLMGEERLKRIIFLPGMPIPKYLNYIKCFDVMIDPYPFGGCNTSMEAFDLDIPVVTMPTRFLNGRFTFGMYKKMGFIDLVADTAQNYITIAVKLGTDTNFKKSMIEKISNNKKMLFQERASVNDWETFLLTAYRNI